MQINDSTVALVTGGASGLGGATVRRLHADGARRRHPRPPVLPGRGAGRGARRAGAVRRRPTSATRRRSRPRSTWPASSASCGSSSTAPGSAPPVGSSASADRCRSSDFPTLIDINLIGTFNVLRLAAAAMLDNEPVDGDRGVVVMTASHRRLRRPDRPGRVCREQGWRRRPHPERGSRLGGQGNSRHDRSLRGRSMTPMLAGLPRRGDRGPRGTGAAPVAARQPRRVRQPRAPHRRQRRCSTARSSGSTAPCGCPRASRLPTTLARSSREWIPSLM